jgi:hypothetical protein
VWSGQQRLTGLTSGVAFESSGDAFLFSTALHSIPALRTRGPVSSCSCSQTWMSIRLPFLFAVVALSLSLATPWTVVRTSANASELSLLISRHGGSADLQWHLNMPDGQLVGSGSAQPETDAAEAVTFEAISKEQVEQVPDGQCTRTLSQQTSSGVLDARQTLNRSASDAMMLDACDCHCYVSQPMHLCITSLPCPVCLHAKPPSGWTGAV